MSERRQPGASGLPRLAVFVVKAVGRTYRGPTAQPPSKIPHARNVGTRLGLKRTSLVYRMQKLGISVQKVGTSSRPE